MMKLEVVKLGIDKQYPTQMYLYVGDIEFVNATIVALCPNGDGCVTATVEIELEDDDIMFFENDEEPEEVK